MSIVPTDARFTGREQRTRPRPAALVALGVLLSWMVPPLYVFAQPEQALYFCPDRPPEQQYAATKGPGCRPLFSEEDLEGLGPKGEEVELPTVEVDRFQQEVSRFLDRYRAYLACCATDPASRDEAIELEKQALAILDTAQRSLFSEQMKIRNFTLRELILPVARAKNDLRDLRARLKDIDSLERALPTMGYEKAGKTRRHIEDLRDAITRDLQLPPSSTGPATGTQIEDSTLPTRLGTGTQDTTLPNTTGSAIGPAERPDLQPRTGMGIGSTPSSGPDIGQTPDTGSAIGDTGRVGPGIGDSSLNQPSR